MLDGRPRLTAHVLEQHAGLCFAAFLIALISSWLFVGTVEPTASWALAGQAVGVAGWLVVGMVGLRAVLRGAADKDDLHLERTRSYVARSVPPLVGLAVFMSGVRSEDDFRGVAEGRADAVLIGEGLMRADDPGAVVDPQGRVIGVDGLRVADSSIFPRITNGNLNSMSLLPKSIPFGRYILPGQLILVGYH